MRVYSYDCDRYEDAALWEAVQAGGEVWGSTSPNPPVGCVIYRENPDAPDIIDVIATGGTEPAGGRHAERVALDAAGEKARGAHMVVTLEPCNHTGRTGPCAEAIVQAGIAKVVYLNADPNPVAAGGAQYLSDHGVAVRHIPYPVRQLDPWLTAMRHGRVSVTAKFAATLDGFTAAQDGTSQWITGPMARSWVHEDRARCDAIIVGTGTVLADDPSLTARKEDGSLYSNQPRRVVVGTRDVPEGNLTRLGYEQYATPQEALDALWATGARHVMVEGGATLMRSMFELGVVDAIQAYLAPMLLGAGRGIMDGPLADTLSSAQRYELEDVAVADDDVLIRLRRKDN
ncbi:bifunctional diaminohydroxyphosphoribosylaminopyrimidine deaminase/5-amino-6-(5-phosphoribosylamino)uracil reductase RibD [Corynebacterium aquatimens]|uniref:Riboflavin biosynthesis protein RibD n=1 Tax=Corynebacterium aquatimens TaxID=1190508 RepID=A0A931DZR5_9CORY|nr:bifunctional diaminohydroxyphosphoribosylaminopyrimidine deaminase/5-amino-6-(5-phosphoribosylamino)uracil reductase RibD [Corynebacterium aquatimens]MBG6121673.1 diaminohydroxyphosphoribosylaminopyrimidine deaminase/5-amino-6-(5-phosphoribosylamino)uracil reductase [Corynebacterium aquatimens]WJY65788.1 Riboflavin biosynthesis protein RibD [Corynebacterium aquatimens]